MIGKVAYVVSRFPKISEIFILREMIAVEQENWSVSLLPLILETPSVIHPDVLEHIYRNPAEANFLAKTGQEKVFCEFEINANAQKLSLLFQQRLATKSELKLNV